MPKNLIRTSKSEATKASKALKSSSSSKILKSLGGSTLSNRRKGTK